MLLNKQHEKIRSPLSISLISVMLVLIIGKVDLGTVIAQQEGTVVCGQIVQGNVTLFANLNCSGDGLIVRDEGTTINLNGYGIYGPGADTGRVGIGVSGDNVVINGPGTIAGFQAGILATGAKELAGKFSDNTRQPNSHILCFRSRHGLNSRKHYQE